MPRECRFHESLGMSEISTFVSTGPGVPVRHGSPGRALPGRRVAVHRDDPRLMVVPTPRATVDLPQRVLARAGETLASRTRPREARLVGSLPRTANEKVVRDLG